MTPAEQMTEKLLSLQNALTSAHPQLPSLLREIHTTLRKDPDLVTALTDIQISIVIAALKKQTATEIVSSASKKTSSTKALKNIGVIDL